MKISHSLVIYPAVTLVAVVCTSPPIIRNDPVGSQPAETLLRERSASPPARRHVLPNYPMFGYSLKSVRLIPNANPNRAFKIHNYTFPLDKPIQIRGEGGLRFPMPTEEQNVLTTSNGDILAIVERDRKRLRGIYTRAQTARRAKINMYTGVVSEMNRAEIKETPLGRSQSVLKSFSVVIVNDSPSQG